MDTQYADKVRSFTELADSIAWDTCHKIYILMDKQQTEQMKSYGYEKLHTSAEMDSKQMAETIEQWFEDSCSLRFISAVASHSDGDKFSDVVGQFDIEFEDDEEEEDD